MRVLILVLQTPKETRASFRPPVGGLQRKCFMESSRVAGGGGRLRKGELSGGIIVCTKSLLVHGVMGSREYNIRR